MRFMQLIFCIQAKYAHLNNGHGEVEKLDLDGHSTRGFDLFNLEDDKLESFFKEYLEERKK